MLESKTRLTVLAVVLAVTGLVAVQARADIAPALVEMIDRMAKVQVTPETAAAFGFGEEMVGESFLLATLARGETCQQRSPVGPFFSVADCNASQATASPPKTGCYKKGGRWYYDMIITVPCPDEVEPGGQTQVGPHQN